VREQNYFHEHRYFMTAKSFPRKQVYTKNFHQKFFGRNFYCTIISLKTGLHQKKFIKHFSSKLYYNCKTTSSNSCLHQCFSSYIFGLRNRGVKRRSAREKGRERFCWSETRRLGERVRQGK